MNKKYEKIISNLIKPVRFSMTGTAAIENFKKRNPEHKIVREDSKATVFEVTMFSRIKYEALVSELVRTEYSLDREFAILRQRDSKKDEFEAYYEFVEQCKADAREFIKKRDGE